MHVKDCGSTTSGLTAVQTSLARRPHTQKSFPCSTRVKVPYCGSRTSARQSFRLTIAQASGGPRQEDLDFAVFRFTLGIPGFNDDLIPRVVGLLAIALLTANHFAAGSAAGSLALTRAESLGAVIALVCLAAPTLQQRLTETQRGATAGTNQSAPVFLLDPDLTPDQRQELAWASYALLRNTAACGMMVVSQGRVLVTRGSLGPAAQGGSAEQTLSALHQAIEVASGPDTALGSLTDVSRQLYLADPSALKSAGVQQWSFAPSDAQSALVVAIAQPESGVAGQLLLFCEDQRALSQRQRSWAAAIASKLYPVCK